MTTLTAIPATVDGAILANLDMLQLRLTQARFRAADALTAMRVGQRKLAIGLALDLEQLLPEIDALYRTIMMLHRTRDVGIVPEEVR